MGSKVVMVNDVARAFFEALAVRNVSAEIPVEDKDDADVKHDKVSHLKMSLNGTRDAAMNWHEEMARVMVTHWFRRGRYHPWLYHHKEKLEDAPPR